MSSSVLKWPRREQVAAALKEWAAAAAQREPRLTRVGYFGSYARGMEGVGSDLDVVLLVTRDDKPPMLRPIDWDLSILPVPADLFVYVESEWLSGAQVKRSGAERIAREVVWVYERPASEA